MPGRVFVTGGSGFVGTNVIDELLGRGYGVTALAHKRELRAGRVRTVKGDVFDAKALDEGISGCDAVIHLVGIIFENKSKAVTFQRMHFEGTRSVVDATQRNGVRRYVHMSALGARSNAVSDYHRTKYTAEEYIRSSGLDWTIFRPSMIHGPGGELMQMEADWARGRKSPFLFMPYFGAGPMGRGGAGMIQPVYVMDVARAFVDALNKPETAGEVYPLGGPDRMTWPEMHRAVAEAVAGKKRWVMPVPAWYARALTRVVPGSMLPFNRDQVIMSQEDNTCDLAKFKGDFGWEPQPFRAALQEYRRQL